MMPLEETMRGQLVTFEGIDGTGKSSVIEMVAEKLTRDGFDVLQTKEPGSPFNQLGLELRQILFHTVTTKRMAPGVADCLLLADHMQHVATVIEPALAEGKVVLSDRYADSEFAYAFGRDIAPVILDAYMALYGPSPNSTVLLLGDPEVCLTRARQRRGAEAGKQEGKAWDDVEMQRQIQHRYVELLRGLPRTIIVSTENLSVEDVVQGFYPDLVRRLKANQRCVQEVLAG